jgi:rod shape-determining protein MreC
MRRLTKRQRIAATVLCVLALSFLVLDLAGTGLRSAHGGVRGTLGALYRGTDAAVGPVREFLAGVPTAGSNRAKLETLRHENAVLRGQLAAAHADATTSNELARLQLAATSGGHRILPARVVALGPGEGFDWTVTLDVGTKDGVVVGQTVTDGAGLVGRILHADPATAVVLLAADPGSGVGVRDLRTGQVGVATGEGLHGFEFAPIDSTAVIKVGDQLSTGPVGSTSYVAGLPVGVVSAVRVSADGSTRATVRPVVSPTTLDLLGVIDTAATTNSTSRAALQPAPGGAPR